MSEETKEEMLARVGSNVKFQGRSVERTDVGVITTETYWGSLSDVENYIDSIDFYSSGENGKNVSAKLSQISPNIWQVEVRAEKTSGGEVTIHPDYTYGKRSQQLHGSVTQVPLSKLKAYRACWDHYLMSKDGTKPSWATSAEDVCLTQEQAKTYCWTESLDSVSKEMDSQERVWTCVQEPTKPGTTHVDFATYTITESVRCKSVKAAAKLCKNMLNKIGTPVNGDMDISKTGWCWKCDDVQIAWTGRYWLVTLAYTFGTWTSDMYGEMK